MYIIGNEDLIGNEPKVEKKNVWKWLWLDEKKGKRSYLPQKSAKGKRM